MTAATALTVSLPLHAEDSADRSLARSRSLVQSALESAWTPAAPAADAEAPRAMRAVVQRRYTSSAGPNIGAFGLGGVAGLSDFEIGPSARYWFTERFGLQGHLAFSGDDWPGDDIDYVRFEPTFIVAIGDFGSDQVNVRPYVGAGLRFLRTDIGSYNDLDTRPAAVGGVEFGFRGAPRLKVSGELSLSASDDFDDDAPFVNPPKFGGARAVGLVHYFFSR